MLRHCSRQCYF